MCLCPAGVKICLVSVLIISPFFHYQIVSLSISPPYSHQHQSQLSHSMLPYSQQPYLTSMFTTKPVFNLWFFISVYLTSDQSSNYRVTNLRSLFPCFSPGLTFPLTMVFFSAAKVHIILPRVFLLHVEPEALFFQLTECPTWLEILPADKVSHPKFPFSSCQSV